jgi:PIN domain nuclease of toxin-antitoxin system
VTVLDTHAWVWWLTDPGRLSRRARTAVDEAVRLRQLYVSCISVWEVALLAGSGRLQFTRPVSDWIAASESLPFLTFVPVDARIALQAVRLPRPFHRDPADRMIVATALALGAQLISKDDRMRVYPDIRTVW